MLGDKSRTPIKTFCCQSTICKACVMKSVIVIKNAFKLPCKCCGQMLTGKFDAGTIIFENALVKDVVATGVRAAVEEALMPDFEVLSRLQ